MRILVILSALILLSACHPSQFSCPEPESVRLKKKAGVNYRVLIARQRASKKITRSELRQLQVRETKSVTVEEWDCPRPGARNTPKQVLENIRKNRKKFESHYKNREANDSTQYINLGRTGTN